MFCLCTGGFLHYFTEDWNESNKFAGTGWANTEWRSYTFASSLSDPSDAHLSETPESRQRRKGGERALDREEHVNLKRTVTPEHKEAHHQGEREQAQAIQAKV